MALIKSVAIEIAIECKKRNIDIDYFKLQKLAYLSQCVHYELYNVPLSPEKIINDSGGPRYNEIYVFFNKYEPSFTLKNTTINKLEKYRDLINYDLLMFEKATINFVIDNFAEKSVKHLIETTKLDPYIKSLNIGDRIYLDKLNYYFISNVEKENFSDNYKDAFNKKSEAYESFDENCFKKEKVKSLKLIDSVGNNKKIK